VEFIRELQDFCFFSRDNKLFLRFYSYTETALGDFGLGLNCIKFWNDGRFGPVLFLLSSETQLSVVVFPPNRNTFLRTRNHSSKHYFLMLQ